MPEFSSLLKAVGAKNLPADVTGLSPANKAQFIAALIEGTGKKGLVLVPDEVSGQRLCSDINTMMGKQTAALYPVREFTFRDVDSVSLEYEHARISVLGRILSGELSVIVAPAEAFLQLTISKTAFLDETFLLDGKYDGGTEQLVGRLVKAGYVRRPQVEGVSQFSLRGGILDIFPPDAPNPVRIEFFGDEIDSIAVFELESQRRIEPIKSIKISPTREVGFPDTLSLAELLEKRLKLVRSNAEAVRAHLTKDIEKLRAGVELASFDRYLPYASERMNTLASYIEDGLIFVSEFAAVKESMNGFLWQHHEDIKVLFEEGILSKGQERFALDYGEAMNILGNNSVLLDTFARSVNDIPIKFLCSVTVHTISPWSGEFNTLLEEVGELLARRYCVIVMAGTKRFATALAADLLKKGIQADFVQSPKTLSFGHVYVMEGYLSSGFEYPLMHTAVITHTNVEQAQKKRSARRNKTQGERLKSLSDLSPGDFVVHVSNGIGVFEGIHKLEMQGVAKDYIKIRYAGTDVLYVPVTQLDLVTKYIGPKEDGAVKLNRLNSAEWQKTRQKVKAAVKDMAKELIKLYAARMNAKGFAYSPDNEWQRQFEDHFDYEETDDQLRCIEEIKSDMERPIPMDRLLCGDVGFGKTEVALRGAFKAVLDSKQCAILVPTTILAWQHYQTLLKRMGAFPVNVELLSRFRSSKEQEKIIKKLKSGEIDIVVGTHRLISKDIQFKNLGLCIVDEEQRFGVAHKEKLKEKYKEIDVLTLTATPIPRTLNMAMSGIRDMSTIEEAPQNRHPVQTYVLEHDWGIIGDAIRRELRRGGQVFYMHNRIDTIETCAGKLRELVPDAQIATAHGRMNEEQLSDIWRNLLDGELQILVCTTIIEAGVDVSNCNTLIIEDADKMGLSQLYQIRGRVGRSSRRAYAYFTFKKDKVLTEIASKRLTAIREFTKFGSGFQIAMRDLEIRGAGNILGGEQHGHMASVGYDLYLKLLSDAVLEERGETVKPSLECSVDIQIEAHIPDKYIENLSQRIDIYKKIAAVSSDEDKMDVLDELIDRFGEIPESVEGLVDVALLRNSAAKLGISEISQKNGQLLFFMESLDMNMLGALFASMRGRVMVSAGNRPHVSVKLNKQSPIDVMREVINELKGK